MSTSPSTPIDTDESSAQEVAYPPRDLVSPQLTARAVLTGMLLGGLLSLCNIYVSLKIGWSTNMSVTGVLLAFVFWNGVRSASGSRVKPFGILENNVNQAACSAAAAVSSAGLAAPIPALAMLTGETLPWIFLAIWVFAVCLVCIVAAAGIRRQMIEVDRLPFPGGIACAAMLRDVYGRGSEAIQRVGMLGLGAVIAGSVKLLEILKIAKAIALPGSIGGHSLSSLDFKFEPSLLMVGVGGLIGFRAAWSIAFGSVLAWLVIAPWALNSGFIDLTARESLRALPDGVALDRTGPLNFVPARHTLEFRGIMSAADREAALALSSDALWHATIRKLETESVMATDPAVTRWTTAVALPLGVAFEVPAEFADRVRVKESALLVDGPISIEAVGSLLSANGATDPTSPLAAALATLPNDSQLRPVTANFTDVLSWLLWPGVTLMVVSSLVSFSFSWRSVVRTFTGRSADGSAQQRDSGDVPFRWFLAGAIVATVIAVGCQMWLFDIRWWAAILGVVLSGVLAIVASRVAGETNITPIGAMGKVTQLVFGALLPANPAANLMTANVTGGAAAQCADLMQDLKTGAMIGATPWKQVIAQVCGAFSGALIGSWFYLILIPDPQRQLLTEEWPAPAVATWKAVAELFMVGFDALPRGAANAMIVAAIVGVVLPVLDRFGPKRLKPLLPSAASLGLSFVVAAKFAISIFLGAILSLLAGKLFPSWKARFLVTLCSGMVVGDALVGAGDAIAQVLGAVLSGS